MLIVFTSRGWINEYGIDFEKVKWKLVDAGEWLNMMIAYVKVSSEEGNESSILVTLKEGKAVNKGAKNKAKKYFKDFVLYNPKTDKEIINHNEGSYFTPTSNTKLFTFYSAYNVLGNSIESLEYIKTKDSLIVKGTADPALFYYGKDSNNVVNFIKKAT